MFLGVAYGFFPLPSHFIKIHIMWGNNYPDRGGEGLSMSSYMYGLFYGIMAAFLNGIVGVLSVLSFENGESPYLVSFYKCLLALLILSLIVLISGKARPLADVVKSRSVVFIAICSFFGFFALFFFETIAYHYVGVASVVFALFSSSVITTFFANIFMEKKRPNKNEVLSALFAFVGLLVFLDFKNLDYNLGMVYAILAGVGYGLFMVFSRKFNIQATLEHLVVLLFFAAIYLSVPFVYVEGFVFPALSSMPFIILLAILPTIGGFYCTIKALSYISGNKVIVIEISELIFATTFAFLFLFQKPAVHEIVGGIVIMISIIYNREPRKTP